MSLWGEVTSWLTDPDNWHGSSGVPHAFAQHLQLTAESVGAAAAVALPLAMWLGHRRASATPAILTANVGRAVPIPGLLVLLALVPAIGVGPKAAVITLLLFAIPPILTNAFEGIRGVDPDAVAAARGMGMREWQVLARVELPLGLPLIANGLRIAIVQVLATATLGALVSSGGLGRFVVEGFALGQPGEYVGGAVLVAALAVGAELILAGLQRLLTPAGLRPAAGRG